MKSTGPHLSELIKASLLSDCPKKTIAKKLGIQPTAEGMVEYLGKLGYSKKDILNDITLMRLVFIFA